MESAGATEIFQRSVQKYGLIYSEYLGDGDTSSFNDVVKAKPYDEYSMDRKRLVYWPRSKESWHTSPCISQKHAGNKDPKKRLSDKGKLDQKVMNSMQNYYGIAIRKNKGDLYAMKKAVGAILWHCSEFPDRDMAYCHRYCPPGKDTSCKYKLDHENQTNNYKSNINLPQYIFDLLLPIFEDLSNNVLLSRFLLGKTQNANETLNSIVWSKCPKNIFVSKDLIEIGLNSAILQFNEGARGVEKVLRKLGMQSGVKTISSERKRKSAEKKGILDKEDEQKKGYISGGFSIKCFS